MQFLRSRRQRTGNGIARRPLFLEPLEDRRLLAANLTLVDAYLVDGQNNQITSPVLGERIGVKVTFEYEDLPAAAEYSLDFTVDGVTLTNSRLAVGAGGGSGTYNLFRTGWHATDGEQTVVVKIDAGENVSEANETDNTFTFNFEPITGEFPMKLIWPLEGTPFTELYISNYVDVDPTGGLFDYTGGNASYDGHSAWDIGPGNFHEMDLGVEVYAAADGTVSQVHDGEFDRYTTWGSPSPTANYVKIDHGDGWQTIYWHLRRDSLQVEEGQVVQQGDFIGYLGSSGKSSGAHLHFGVRHHGRIVEPAIDPETFFLEPLRYVGDAPTVYLSGITNDSPSDHAKERPSDVEVFPQATGQKTYAWARFAGLRENDSVQYVWKKPNGSTYFTGTTQMEQDYSNSQWWFSRTLPSTPDLGTWTVEFHVNGSKLGEDSFQVTASGAPEIRVEEEEAIVLDERYTPVDFGSVSKDATSPGKVFTVTNHGSDTLTLGTPSAPPGFSISEGLASSLAPGAADAFTVNLDTDTAGYFAGQVRFTSNDADEDAYNFSVEGIVDAELSNELVLGITERHANEGESVYGNVRRSGSTANDLLVTLTSADTTEVILPASVIIPAGEERAIFVVQVVDDQEFDTTQVTGLAASATGHATAHNTLDVINQEVLTLSLGQASLSEAAAPVDGTVTRTNADLSQALTVHLASSDTTGLIVPTTITLDAQQSSVTFPVTPQDDTLLDGSQDVTVTASATGYPDVDALLTVTDHETLTVTLQNAVIVEQVSTTGTVTRSNTDNVQSLVVALAASDSSEVTLPASVTIASGQESASFLVTAIDDGLVDATQTTEIEAVAVGYISQAAQLQVVDHPFPWQNVSNALDVDGNGSAVTLDVLIIINNLNIEGARTLPVPTTQFTPPPYYDVSGDGFITALDALVVINYLNQQSAGEGEKVGSFGEAWEFKGRGPGAGHQASVELTGATASGDAFIEARDRFFRAFVQLAKTEKADDPVGADLIVGWRPLEELLNSPFSLFF